MASDPTDARTAGRDDLEALQTRAAAAEGELEALAAALSHDLRAPLRAIDGFSRILLGGERAAALPEDTRRFLALVRDAGSELAELLDDLVDIARLAHVPLDRRPVDPAALARELVACGELPAPAGDGAVAWELGDVPAAEADPALLRRLLRELFDNAVKFGGRRVELAWDAQAGAYAVRDDGIGLHGELPAQALAIFGRLHSQDAYPGTGAGLAIAARIAARHGGRLWGAGVPDEGTTVWFTLAPAI